MILTESPRRKRVTSMVTWGHWFALANIVLALFISSIYIFSSPAPGTWLGNTFMVANWLGHISFITFFGFVIFILPTCYLVKNEKAIRLTGSFVSAIGLALLAFDALLYTRTGFHISFNAEHIVRSAAETRISEFGLQQWIYLSLLFVVWFGCQLVLANGLWRRLEKLSKFKFGPSVTSFFLTCFITGHGIHIWADAHLYQPVVKQDNLFPLSYPATAKTTMSRYGLLDLDAYKQRKTLQFDNQVSAIRYPANPIYCSVNNTASATVFVQTDTSALAITQPAMVSRIPFYVTASDNESRLISTVFGIPEIYAKVLDEKRPVLLALPHAQGMHVSVSYDGDIDNSAITAYKKPFPVQQPGLHIAFMSGQAITDTLAQTSFDNAIIMVAGNDTFHANIPLSANSASSEDIAPTVLNALGCDSSIDSYSTGRNLASPAHDWIVSTSGERIVVIYKMQRIEVMSNGNYEIINLADNTRSSEGLNIKLLSQAVKHLTRFSTAN